jgi:hypothetical protein
MRFFAILLFAFFLAVSAAPRNVPQWAPGTVADFNAPSSVKEKRSFESLQAALDAWLNPVVKVSQFPCCVDLGRLRGIYKVLFMIFLRSVEGLVVRLVL